MDSKLEKDDLQVILKSVSVNLIGRIDEIEARLLIKLDDCGILLGEIGGRCNGE